MTWQRSRCGLGLRGQVLEREGKQLAVVAAGQNFSGGPRRNTAFRQMQVHVPQGHDGYGIGTGSASLVVRTTEHSC
jgi:hypothetical protein